MSKHPFPMTEPEVTVTPRPDASLKEVLRVDAGGGFVPLEVGAQTMWSFYDWPERQLTNVCDSKVRGVVEYGDLECLEILDHYIYPEEEESVGRSLFVKSEETLRQVLSESRESEVRGRIEEVDTSPDPLRLRLGQSWTGHEVARCGPKQRGEGHVQHYAVDGCFDVTVPAGKRLCLRETFYTLEADGAGLALAELYVAENGRSVYWRRFNGPAYHNYQQLTDTPRREHAGIDWRLYYDCLPDISLAQ